MTKMIKFGTFLLFFCCLKPVFGQKETDIFKIGLGVTQPSNVLIRSGKFSLRSVVLGFERDFRKKTSAALNFEYGKNIEEQLATNISPFLTYTLDLLNIEAEGRYYLTQATKGWYCGGSLGVSMVRVEKTRFGGGIERQRWNSMNLKAGYQANFSEKYVLQLSGGWGYTYHFRRSSGTQSRRVGIQILFGARL